MYNEGEENTPGRSCTVRGADTNREAGFMTVNEIFLDGFRNYYGGTARLEDKVNVIVGQNAQGKTNLIESIFYLTSGRSFRPAADKDLIAHDRQCAYIKADIQSGGRSQTVEAKLYRGRRRELYANGVKLKKASELSGRLMAVVFGPDDLDIIKDGAAVRRKLMDQCLSQLRPGYLAALTEFSRLYDHKTRILRDHADKPSLLDVLDDFDQRMAQQSAKLIYYRTAFSASLSRRASEIHSEFSEGVEELSIVYRTVGGIDATGKKPEDILPGLLEHQREHRQAELRTRSCLSGAHKDDLEININGVGARRFASQGQARTAAVSVKLAEREIHRDESGEYPVLLLDDVLSELDWKRQGFILDKISNGQVLITCCDDLVMRGRDVFCIRVEKGMFR